MKTFLVPSVISIILNKNFLLKSNKQQTCNICMSFQSKKCNWDKKKRREKSAIFNSKLQRASNPTHHAPKKKKKGYKKIFNIHQQLISTRQLP